MMHTSHHNNIQGLDELEIYEKRNDWMKQIIITGLPHIYSELYLRRKFSVFGQVVSVNIKKVQKTNIFYGIVEFADGRCCLNAANIVDGTMVKGCSGYYQQLLISRNFSNSQFYNRNRAVISINYLPKKDIVKRLLDRMQTYGRICDINCMPLNMTCKDNNCNAEYNTTVLITFEDSAAAFSVIKKFDGKPFDDDGRNLVVKLSWNQMQIDSVWHAFEICNLQPHIIQITNYIQRIILNGNTSEYYFKENIKPIKDIQKECLPNDFKSNSTIIHHQCDNNNHLLSIENANLNDLKMAMNQIAIRKHEIKQQTLLFLLQQETIHYVQILQNISRPILEEVAKFTTWISQSLTIPQTLKKSPQYRPMQPPTKKLKQSVNMGVVNDKTRDSGSSRAEEDSSLSNIEIAKICHLRKYQPETRYQEEERQTIVDRLIDMKNGHYGNGIFVKHNLEDLYIEEGQIEYQRRGDETGYDENGNDVKLLSKNSHENKENLDGKNATTVDSINTDKNVGNDINTDNAMNSTTNDACTTTRTSVLGESYTQNMLGCNRRLPSGALIYVRHLSEDYNAIYLFQLFSQYGSVLRVDRAHDTHNSGDGYAFVTMRLLSRAKIAIRDIEQHSFGDTKVNIQIVNY